MDEIEHRSERQIEWLRSASTEDWHRVAVCFDAQWDGPTDHLFWIVRQPQCEKATALTIFWKARPKDFLGMLVNGQQITSPNRLWEMVQFIAQRLNQNSFNLANIAFEATPYCEDDYDALVALAGQFVQSPLTLHRDMKQSINGKRISVNGAFAKRYPLEFHNDELRDEYLIARQIDFLEDASPDDWHRAADDLNWDRRLDLLYWIVRQPECDKATSLLIFWKGEPTGYDFETEEQEMGDDSYAVEPMLKYIVQRFNTTGYTRSEIAFDYIEAKGGSLDSEYAAIMENGRLSDLQELAERQKDSTDPLLKIHPDLKLSKIPGRKVGGHSDSDAFYDNFPQESHYYQERDVSPTDWPKLPLADTDNDASARIRAMRRGDVTQPLTDYDSGGYKRPRRSATQHPDTETSFWDRPRTNAAVLIGDLICLGFAAIYLKVHAAPHIVSGLNVLVVVGLMSYLIYSAVSSFRDLKNSADANGMPFPDRWSMIVANASFAVGALLGYFFGASFAGLLQTLVSSFGKIPATIVALVMILPIWALISWSLAPLMINRRLR